MASWDYPAVNGPTTANYAPPVQDFSSLGNVLQDFVKGRQAGREEDKARVFRNGIPRVGNDPNGPIDVNAVTDKLARINPDYATPLINMQIMGQYGQAGSDAIDKAYGIANNGQPQATGAPRSAVSAGPGAQPGATRQVGDSPGSIMSVLSDADIPNDQIGALAGRFAAALKIDQNAPLTPQQRAMIEQRLAPIKSQIGAVVQPQAAPAEQPTAAPNERVAQTFESPQGVALTNPSIDNKSRAAAYLRSKAAPLLANPTTAKVGEGLNQQAGVLEDQVKQERQALLSANEPTGNMKEYRQAVVQGYKGSADEWAAQTEGDKATSQERAKSDVKEQNEYIKAGKQAGNRLTTLNTIGNIVNSDKNLTLGFGADTALKVKMALQQLGVNVGDLSGAEGIQKMNAALASEMAKSLSARPTQFEFKSFMANNPGLLLDKSGNQRLIGIYSQLAQREYQLGKMARQNGDNWSNWDNVVEKYDAQHPIVDPISKQPISTNSIIAPGPDKAKAATSPAAPPQEGAMAINPKTGERLKLQGGKWVPFA